MTLVTFGTSCLWDSLLSGVVTFGLLGCIAESILQHANVAGTVLICYFLVTCRFL